MTRIRARSGTSPGAVPGPRPRRADQPGGPLCTYLTADAPDKDAFAWVARAVSVAVGGHHRRRHHQHGDLGSATDGGVNTAILGSACGDGSLHTAILGSGPDGVGGGAGGEITAGDQAGLGLDGHMGLEAIRGGVGGLVGVVGLGVDAGPNPPRRYALGRCVTRLGETPCTVLGSLLPRVATS